MLKKKESFKSHLRKATFNNKLLLPSNASVSSNLGKSRIDPQADGYFAAFDFGAVQSEYEMARQGECSSW